MSRDFKDTYASAGSRRQGTIPLQSPNNFVREVKMSRGSFGFRVLGSALVLLMATAPTMANRQYLTGVSLDLSRAAKIKDKRLDSHLWFAPSEVEGEAGIAVHMRVRKVPSAAGIRFFQETDSDLLIATKDIFFDVTARLVCDGENLLGRGQLMIEEGHNTGSTSFTLPQLFTSCDLDLDVSGETPGKVKKLFEDRNGRGAKNIAFEIITGVGRPEDVGFVPSHYLLYRPGKNEARSSAVRRSAVAARSHHEP